MAADTKQPYGDVAYADPGYQKDKQKRYPIDTKAHAKSAWSYVNQPDNAKLYTANQLKRIKGRIKSALKRFGVQIAVENWLIDTADAVTETTVGEHYTDMYGDGPGTFCLNATNGPLSVTISSTCVEPADLEFILKAIVDSAVTALKNVDPDMDGDMDVPGASSEDTDDDMESTESAPDDVEQVEEGEAPKPTIAPPAEPAPAVEEPEDPAPEPAAANKEEKEEPAMADSTPQEAAVEQAAATTQPAEPSGLDALNAKFDKLTDAISGLVSKMAPAPAVAAESAPPAAAPTQETTTETAEAPKAEVTESEDERIARIVAERMQAERTKLVQELAESGQGPSRKGLVAPVNEHTAPVGTQEWPEGWPTENGSPKPLHKWTDTERREHMNPAIEQYVLGSRARA